MFSNTDKWRNQKLRIACERRNIKTSTKSLQLASACSLSAAAILRHCIHRKITNSSPNNGPNRAPTYINKRMKSSQCIDKISRYQKRTQLLFYGTWACRPIVHATLRLFLLVMAIITAINVIGKTHCLLPMHFTVIIWLIETKGHLYVHYLLMYVHENISQHVSDIGVTAVIL